jgi:hypothetical protein
MNANFIFNPTLALRLPYSTLAAGLIWMPIPLGSRGGITVSSTVLNTADSSTTTGFDDFGEGTTLADGGRLSIPAWESRGLRAGKRA